MMRSATRPIMALPQPGDIVDHGGGPRLDAAVIAIDRLMPTDCRVLETIGFSVRRQAPLHPCATCLVPFSARCNRPSCHDLRGDFPLTPIASIVTMAFDRQHVEELGNRDDFVRLSAP